MTEHSVLILDDDRAWLVKHEEALSRAGFTCLTTQLGEEAIALANSRPDIRFMLIDMILLNPEQSEEVKELQSCQGKDVITTINSQRRDMRFIIISDEPLQTTTSQETDARAIMTQVFEQQAALLKGIERSGVDRSAILHFFHKQQIRVDPNLFYQEIASTASSLTSDFDDNASIVIEFLEKLEVRFEQVSKKEWTILEDIRGIGLSNYAAFPILLTNNPKDQDINYLYRQSKRLKELKENSKHPCGIIIYGQDLDSTSRWEIGKVRESYGFYVIPIALDHIEKALRCGDDCLELLKKYVNNHVYRISFFNDKIAIVDRSCFFGRDLLVDQIRDVLINRKSVGIFGLRKIGKTSLLNRLEQVFISDDHPTIRIDLQTYMKGTSNNDNDVFRDMITSLNKLLINRSFNGESNATIDLDNNVNTSGEEFSRQVRSLSLQLQQHGCHLPIICLLDEIEGVLPLIGEEPETSRQKARRFTDFFGTLRALCQTDRLLVLVVADLYPDCNRINEWSKFGVQGVRTNPVFQFFQEFPLANLSEEDTQDMLISLGNLMARTFDQSILEEIYHYSGGHPFVARQIASYLHEKLPAWRDYNVAYEQAIPHLRNLLSDPESSELCNYCNEGLLEPTKRQSMASQILSLLACNESKQPISRQVLSEKFNQTSHDELQDSLLWLQSMGMLKCIEQDGIRSYSIQIALLANAIRNKMNTEERQAWVL